MATHRLPILGFTGIPDTTGDAFMQPIDDAVTLVNNTVLGQLVLTMKDVASDCGVKGSFKVPKNYIGTPKVVVSLIEEAASSGNLGFEFSYVAIANGESVDTAFVENKSWTQAGANSALNFTETSAALGSNFSIDDVVQFYLKRDVTGDTFSGEIHVMSLEFEYADA